MGNYFWTPGTEASGRIHAFYSAGQLKTPADSSECSPEFSEIFLEQFSIPPVMCLASMFGARSQSVFFWRVKNTICLSELGPEKMDFWRSLVKNHDGPQNWQYGRLLTVKPRPWRNGKVLKKSPRRTNGQRASCGPFDPRTEWIARFRQKKKTVLERPLKNFPRRVDLKAFSQIFWDSYVLKFKELFMPILSTKLIYISGRSGEKKQNKMCQKPDRELKGTFRCPDDRAKMYRLARSIRTIRPISCCESSGADMVLVTHYYGGP